MGLLSRGIADRGRFAELEPIGVVDIGSNSVRLVVYEGAVRAPTPLFNEKVLCGLGRSVATTGRLSPESVERAITALARFRAIARILDVKNLKAFATAAVRDASNGAAFLERGQQALGQQIELWSGEREANLAALGIAMGFNNPDGFAGDLGGGSLELVDITGSERRNGITLPLGGLRLIDVTGERLDKAVDIADEQIGRVPWLGLGKGRPFYAVGGTWRAIAKLHMEQTDYPLRVMQGYTISTRDAIAFCETLRRKKMSSVDGIAAIAKPRREVLPYGALVLERLLKRLEPSALTFSVFGVREGLVYSLLPESEKRKDALLSFCEDYARLRSRSVVHSHELCTWTDPLFSPPGPDETPEEKRLRYAACLLSDIGWRAHPDYRGEQSLNVIAHAALAGIDHPGRLFLALSIYFRHAGAGSDQGEELSARLKAIASKRALKRARILAAAVRVAHMLSVGMPGIIDETPLSYEGGRLVLSLPERYAALDGERLRRRFETLAELVDKEPLVKNTA